MSAEGGSFESTRAMPNSVELSRNAKGEYSWSIKRYYDAGDEDTTLAAIEDIDAKLKAIYIPMAEATR